MSTRLAELFVEISASNKTGPVFAQIKKEMQEIGANAATLGYSVGRAASMPMVNLEKELAKRQAAFEKLAREATRRHHADLAGQSGPNQAEVALQQRAAEALRRHNADIAAQSGGVNEAVKQQRRQDLADYRTYLASIKSQRQQDLIDYRTYISQQKDFARAAQEAVDRHRADITGQSGVARSPFVSPMMAQLSAGMKSQQMNMAALAASGKPLQSQFQFPTIDPSKMDLSSVFDKSRLSAKSVNDEAEIIITNFKRAKATAGMTTMEVKAWDLAQRGAKQSALDMLRPLVDQERQQTRLQQSVARMSQDWGYLRRNMYVLMYAATGATAAIGGFVAAASPDIWNTFTGSIKDASGAIGTAFSPAIIEISYKLQQFADWFDALDESTKKNFASWTLWGIGIFAGSVAIVAMLRVLVAVKDMLMVVYSGLMLVKVGLVSHLIPALITATAWLKAFAMAHPVTALAALAVMLGTVTFGLSRISSGAADATANLQDMESILERLQGGGELTRREFERLFDADVRQRLAGATPQQQMALLQSMEVGLTHEVGQQADGAERARRLEARLQAIQGGDHTWLMQRRATGEALEEAGLRPRGGGHSGVPMLTNENIRQFVDQARGPQTQAQAQLAATRSLMQQGGVPANLLGTGGANPMRTDVKFQSKMGSVEDVWKNLQLTATSMTPIEQRALQRHVEQISRMDQQINLLNSINGAVGGITPAIANQNTGASD